MTKKEIALSLLARGWAVIPLYPKSKIAAIKWTEYQKRLPTPAEVEAWWTIEPDHNIGIITGPISGIIVGDVDPRNGGSVQEMQRDAPSPFVVTTPGGGAHFYFRHPGGRCQKGKPRPGIDRQSDGCYVVAAGSYVETATYAGEYHQLSEGDLPEAPTWLIGEPEAAVPAESQSDWIARTLTMGCPPGTRNDTLAKLAGYLAGRGLPVDVADSLLLPWILRQRDTKVTYTEARTTIASIYAKERRSVKSGADPDEHLVVDEFDEKLNPDRPLQTVPLETFVPLYWEEKVAWLIPDWLPEESITFLVSPPAHFKTMLTFDVAISVAGGWPYLGRYPVQNPGPVLVIQQEDHYGDMARRFHRIFAARAPELVIPDTTEVGDVVVGGIPPVHICTTRGFTLDITNLRKLERLIRDLQPRLIIIDPLYSITSAEDFMVSAAHDMMPLKKLRDTYHCGFLIAAHTKKGATGVDREGLWGSQFLNAFLETGWQIRGQHDGEWNQVQLQRHFKSAGQPGLLNLEFVLGQDEGYQVAVTDADDDDAPQDVLTALLANYPDGLPGSEIIERTGLSSTAVYKRLKRLKKKGAVVEGTAVRGGHTWKIPKDTTKEVEVSHGD